MDQSSAECHDLGWVCASSNPNVPVIHDAKKAIARVRRRMNVDFRGHDLRRTAASIMASAGVSRLVVAKVVNHVETGVTAVYDRHSDDAEKRAASRCTFALLRAPCDRQPLLTGRAVAQVEVDQRLIPDAGLLGERLEVGNRRIIEPNRDLTFQPSGVRVSSCLREIVFFPHLVHLCRYVLRSVAVAFRAEMMRMAVSEAR